MSRKQLALAILVGSLSSAGWAGGESSAYKEVDANQDGYISQEEGAAVEGLTENWSAVDANQDGKLDEAEFARFEAATAPEGQQ